MDEEVIERLKENLNKMSTTKISHETAGIGLGLMISQALALRFGFKNGYIFYIK